MRLHTRSFCFVVILLALAIPLRCQTINCSSEDGGRHYCNADTHQGVQMLNQRSGSPCVQGSSWDYDNRGIWVDHGCRADFLLNSIPLDMDKVVNCSSEDGRRHYCQIDARAGVQLIRQHSGSPCTKGSSWDFDGRGLWVDHGCRADFAPEISPARHEEERREGDRPDRQTIYCASDDGGRNYCSLEARGRVELVRQRSGAPCTQGYSWDMDEGGLWVDHGCRADFALGHRDHDRDHDRDLQDDSDSRSCARTLGYDRANELVNKCLQVSPATHPPCNARNSCSLINEEIRRGCAQLGPDAPRFCDQYR